MLRLSLLATGLWMAFAVHAESTLIEQARAVDPEYQTIQAQMSALEQQRPALSRWSPDAPSLTLASVTDRLNGNEGAEEWEAELEWPLWLPGQRQAGQQLYSLSQQLLQAELMVRDWQLSDLIHQTHWALTHAKHKQVFAYSKQQTIQKLAADAQRQLKAGTLSENELLEIETELLEVEEQLAAAESDYSESSAEWLRISGGSKPLSSMIEQELPPPAEHPQRRLARLQLKSAQAHSRQAELNRRETPSLGVMLRQERPSRESGYEQVIGLSVTIPFSMASHYVVGQSEAEQAVTEAQIELRALEQELRLLQTQATIQLELARKRLPLTERKHLLATRGLELAQQAYVNGAITQSELLKKQLLVNNTSNALQSTQLDVSQAIANLNFSFGAY